LALVFISRASSPPAALDVCESHEQVVCQKARRYLEITEVFFRRRLM
jgi:hypothetical protein